MKNASLHDLLVMEVQDLYSAEEQLIQALPKMAEAADDSELIAAFEDHLKQTEMHLKRLEEIAQNLGFELKGKKCQGMAGLITEGEELIKTMAKSPFRDLALIGAAQRVEHYEIAGYGTARTLADMMAHDEEAEVLQHTLDEEGETDENLTDVAEVIMDKISDEEAEE